MYRPAKAYIDLPALRHNLAVVKCLTPNSKVLAVVKANGYGHGIGRVAHQLSAADGFGVACIEEAIVLRQKGFLHRILLLEGVFSESEMPLVYQYQLDLVVHCEQQLNWLLSCRKTGKMNVWLKIDTGMHRLGMPPQKVAQTVQRLELSGKPLQIHLISHLASADESELFTQQQMACFESVTQDYAYPKSLANSAGLQRYPNARYDWVRPGIMLYGAGHPDAMAAGIRPVMKLVSAVIAVKTVAKNDYVGYGNTWQAQRPSRIGVVAIGYGDGYPRHAPSGTPVLIDGERVPLIGRVSMDMICVDLTDHSREIQPGVEAVLWGDDSLSVDEVADCAGTIGYELLCGVTKRVPFIEVQ
jgi:alanine racemase